MTVGEIIAEGLRLHHKLSNTETQDEVAKWLEQVGLHPDHRSRYPTNFQAASANASVLPGAILQPEFVVCDEPISALDVSVQAR